MFVEEKRQGEVTLPVDKWRQDLLNAVDLIERAGWWNGVGSGGFGSGGYCVSTALGRVEADRTASDRLLEAVRWHSNNTYVYLVEWNDHSTKEIVVATMRQVARSE